MLAVVSRPPLPPAPTHPERPQRGRLPRTSAQGHHVPSDLNRASFLPALPPPP